MITNSTYSQYCKYLKHLLEVECAEKDLDFDKLFISYINSQPSNQEKVQKQEEKERLEREKREKEEALKKELEEKNGKTEEE